MVETVQHCPVCGGRGLIQWHPYWDNGNDPCEACGGTGMNGEIEATRATAGQFGHSADGGIGATDHSGDDNKKVADLIEREAALSAICSHAHYDDDWGDLVCAIRAIPAAQLAPKVKPLEWLPCGHNGQYLKAAAFGVNVFYLIYGEPGNWTLQYPGEKIIVSTPGYAMRAGAQAAAQADYADRARAVWEVFSEIEGDV